MPNPVPTHRLRPTPAWLIVGLLVVEGLLWLAERYTWFWFNEHKGWTVLIAVAAVGATMLVMLAWFVASLVFRWRFQFSVRSLLVLTLAVALPSSWLGIELQRAKRQWEAVAEIKKVDGVAFYDWQFNEIGNHRSNAKLPVPKWLRSLLGDDVFQSVRSVNLPCTKFTDAGLEHLKGLNQLQELHLEGSQTTDAGLENLKGLSKLRFLVLASTKVTGAGLQHLKCLGQLEFLCLSGTQVTDAGLENLEGLSKLESLRLAETQITDTGLGYLRGLGKLQDLDLNGTRITDAGLAKLKGCTELQELWLNDTGVTDIGLEHLRTLNQLRQVYLDRTQVTDQGVEKLKQALPNCEIIHRLGNSID
jgi:hypothetical protein